MTCEVKRNSVGGKQISTTMIFIVKDSIYTHMIFFKIPFDIQYKDIPFVVRAAIKISEWRRQET